MIELIASFAALLGDFRVFEQIDPITDAKSVMALFVDPKTEASVGIGCRDVKKQELFAAISLSRYVGRAQAGILAGGVDVQYRLDDRPSIDSRWNGVDDTISLRDHVQPDRFIRELKNSTKLYVRAYAYDGNRVEAGFTYENPAAVIDDVLGRCGFSPDGAFLRHWKP